MKIGVFDSGLGGLVIAHSLIEAMPEYDYIYLGDTLHLPYGEKKTSEIYEYTKTAIDFLFAQDAALIIIACNTATAAALRKIQQEYLPKTYPGKNVLGIIRPTIEAACQNITGPIGLIATRSTINSKSYEEEIKKVAPTAEIIALSTPLLVPFLEAGNYEKACQTLPDYLAPFIAAKAGSLILGCTHYPLLKTVARNLLPSEVSVISQDEIIAESFKDYLIRHPEYASKLSKNGSRSFFVTGNGQNSKETAARFFSSPIEFEKIILPIL